MKVKYVGKGSFHTRGLRFNKDEDYDIAQELFDYLTKTFGTLFEVLEVAPKVVEEVKPEVVEKPKPKRAKKSSVSEKE